MRRVPAFALVLGFAMGGVAPQFGAAQEPQPPQQKPADEAPTTPRSAVQPRSAALAEGLRRQLDHATQLRLGSDDAFLALWQPANTAEPRGVLIIVPSEGETANWPRVVAPLRRALPEHGWHTLSLTPTDAMTDPLARLPAPAQAPTPAPTEDAAEQDMDADTAQASAPASAGYLPEQTTPADDEPSAEPTPEQDTAPASHAERMQARLAAAVEHARSAKPAKIVLVGHGTGAYWASQYLAQVQPKDIRQLIVIDPHRPASAEQSLEDLLSALPTAVGDFHTVQRPAAQRQALQRRNAARRAGHPDYRQVALPTLAADRDGAQQQLVRRVRGWLDRQPPR
ncbi:hydrolase or acyltransferase [Stutzerimonas stutzeri TS44]|nr:hydrolase or acyltransferase [Stutzerimonas stutzeri TS44]